MPKVGPIRYELQAGLDIACDFFLIDCGDFYGRFRYSVGVCVWVLDLSVGGGDIW